MHNIPSPEHYEALKVRIKNPEMTWEQYETLNYVFSDQAMIDLRQAMADLQPQKEVKTPQWAINLNMWSVLGIPLSLIFLAPFIGIYAWGHIALTLACIFVVSMVLSVVFTKEVG